MKLAPIAIFVYNRPIHAKRTIDALLLNQESYKSDLFIFSDAAKNHDNKVNVNAVEEVRKYIASICGFKSITIIEREINFGLAKSIIEGVTDILNKHESIIVLEDDMITSTYFLQYMNESLNFYKNDDKIASIHGYVYPTSKKLPETFFLKGTDCWGWATWKKSWMDFNANGEFLLSELKRRKLTYQFDFNGSAGYTEMLIAQIQGRNDSWAVRWYASAFLLDKLTLYPGRSLVQNIGIDSSGTHCGTNSDFELILSNKPIKIEPISIEDSKIGRKAFINFFNSRKTNHTLLKKMAMFIKRKLKL
jgi:hypothetical protein